MLILELAAKPVPLMEMVSPTVPEVGVTVVVCSVVKFTVGESPLASLPFIV